MGGTCGRRCLPISPFDADDVGNPDHQEHRQDQAEEEKEYDSEIIEMDSDREGEEARTPKTLAEPRQPSIK